jgi:predicted alpha/beta superfamily hydrolase
MFGIFKVSSFTPLLVLLLALNVTSVIAAQSPHITKIKSKVYGVDREIMVSLPSNYQQDEEKIYPVIYLTDAQMHIPHAAPMIQFLAGGISELIVVGVQTFDRQNELSPFREDGSEFSRDQGAEQLLKFIETEVKPHINTTYRTAPFEILSGHSLGGLFTVYAFTRHPDSFDAYFALSPTLAYANSSILNGLDEYLVNVPRNKILVAYSEQETPFENQYKAFSQFLMLLKTKAPDWLDSQARFISGEDHMTIAHLGLYHALRHTFRDWWLFSNAMVGAPEKFDAHYKRLSTRLGYEIVPEFNELWALTAYLIREQHYDEAHYLINKWQSYYPKQSAPHYELAQLFLAQMKPLQAAESIKFALKYAPPNSSQYKRSQELHKVIIDTL